MLVACLLFRWRQLADAHGDALAVVDPHNSPATKLTYRELASHIQRFAAGLSQLGLGSGERVCVLSLVHSTRENITCLLLKTCPLLQVALFSENSSRWLIADQGIMTVGAADAVSP